MGRGTGKATEMKKRLKTPVKKYLVTVPGNLSIPVEANDIQEDGDTLVFKILWEWNDGNDEEIVGMFKQWEFFTDFKTVESLAAAAEWGKKFEALKQTKTP